MRALSTKVGAKNWRRHPQQHLPYVNVPIILSTKVMWGAEMLELRPSITGKFESLTRFPRARGSLAKQPRWSITTSQCSTMEYKRPQSPSAVEDRRESLLRACVACRASNANNASASAIATVKLDPSVHNAHLQWPTDTAGTASIIR